MIMNMSTGMDWNVNASGKSHGLSRNTRPALRLMAAFVLVTTFPLTGCSIIGNNIDKLGSDKTGQTVYLDSNGKHVVRTPVEERIRSDPNSFSSRGADVDKEIFKALTTRRQTHDTAPREEPGCPDGEIQSCSISAGCVCRAKRGPSAR